MSRIKKNLIVVVEKEADLDFWKGRLTKLGKEYEVVKRKGIGDGLAGQYPRTRYYLYSLDVANVQKKGNL